MLLLTLHHSIINKLHLQFPSPFGLGFYWMIVLFLFCSFPVIAQNADETRNPQQSQDAGKEENGGVYTYRRKGVMALEDEVYSAAQKFFEKYREAAVFTEPKFVDATILLVKSLLLQDKVEKAGDALTYHSKNTPGVEDPQYKETLRYWQIRTYKRSGRIEKTLSAIDDFVNNATDPRLIAKALQVKASIELKQQESYEKAIQTYNRIINNYKEYIGSEPYFLLVQAYLGAGQTDKADDALENAQQNTPDEDDAALTTRKTLYQALVHLRNGRLDSALDNYDKIKSQLDKQQLTTETWLLLKPMINKCMENGRYEKAINLVPAAMSVAPTTAEEVQLQLTQADALINRDQLELAINTLTEIKDQYPQEKLSIRAEYKLAELLKQTGNNSLAAEHFNNLADNEKAEHKLRYNAALERAKCLRSAEQYSSASQAFIKASELAEDDSQKAHMLLLAGDAAFTGSDYSNAAMHYKNVAENLQDTEYAEKARLKQAKARAKASLYSAAASIYEKFLEEYPKSKHKAEALLGKGAALKNAGNFKEAVTALEVFSENFPQHEKLPMAMFEAFEASKALGNFDQAIDFLQNIIDNKPQSDEVAQAMYQQIHLLFLLQRNTRAQNKALEFLDKYPQLPLSADVLIWLGDHLANKGDYEKAQNRYLKVVSQHPDTRQAQTALLEAAKCGMQVDDNSGAMELLIKLTEDYQVENTSEVHARAYMLIGNLHAQKGNFHQALQAFQKAESVSEQPRLRFTATAKIADMRYSLATGGLPTDKSRAMLQEAVETYKTIIDSDESPADITENAKYRLGKCYEKLDKAELAIEKYLDVFYQYNLDLMQNDNIRDWYYFARSGYDAAKLLLLQKNREQAARIYERIAESGVPTNKNAAEAARQIRRKMDSAGE